MLSMRSRGSAATAAALVENSRIAARLRAARVSRLLRSLNPTSVFTLYSGEFAGVAILPKAFRPKPVKPPFSFVLVDARQRGMVGHKNLRPKCPLPINVLAVPNAPIPTRLHYFVDKNEVAQVS